MHRVLTVVSLCAAVFALGGGCQQEPSSQPCACPKGTGCQCPLPGSHASGGANQGGAETAKHEPHVARAGHHRRHRVARAEHRERMREQMESREAEREAQEEGRGKRERESFGGAAPYGYRSPSHRYAFRQGRQYAEEYGSEQTYGYGMHRHFHHMHRFTERPGYGPESDENGPNSDEEAYSPESQQEYGPKDEGEPEYSARPEEQAGPEPRTTSAGQMSINSPSALDSWHGYGVDCPELYDRE